MLRNFLKNKKAQNTAEYAILIGLVVAATVAMQTFAQRSLQARVHDASKYMKDQTTAIGQSIQYEPYYQNSDYNQVTNSEENKRLGKNLDAADLNKVVSSTGGQAAEYNENNMREKTGQVTGDIR